MNWNAISRNVGYALLVSALFMLLSIGVSLIDGGDSALAPLLISFMITVSVGAFPFIFVRRTSAISLKEGYVIITLSWLLSFVFGMLPYALWGEPFSVINAWFESVSGYTTTGATILDDIESLPRSLLFWRASTHFIGGLGVVVFLLLIIPDSSPVRLRLTNMELSSLSRKSYSISTTRTVYVFAYVYLGIGILAYVGYLLAGMSAFDAVCHAFSVCATGGFSTRNCSIAAFQSPLIEALTLVFMLLSSLHFGLLYLSVINKSLRPLNSPVVKFYLSALIVASLGVGLSLKYSGVEDSLGTALWYGTFQTVSIATTTGFGITDNAPWPLFSNIILLMMALMCACAGSTSGGLKADRILVLFKAVRRQVLCTLHPSAVNEVKLGGRVLRDNEVAPHVLYIALYFTVLSFAVLFGLLFGMRDQNAFSAAISSLGNVGPAIAEQGTMGNFDGISAAAKGLYTFCMFLGRIEIYPFLAVIALIFGRKRRI